MIPTREEQVLNYVQFSVNCNKDRVFANMKATDVFTKQFNGIVVENSLLK